MTKLSIPDYFRGKYPARRLGKRADRIVETAKNSVLRGTDCRFEMPPIGAAINGAGAAVTTDAAVNLMNCDGVNFEVLNIATSTITTPVWASTGLNIARDLTDDEGCELTQGITSRAKHAYTVGTDDGVFFEVTFKITDVSGTDICLVGWRKAEAYQADWNSYTNLTALNVISGAINSSTIVGSASAVNTDLSSAWADAASHTLRVEVHGSGKVHYFVDAVRVTNAPDYVWASATVIVPFMHFQHDTDIAESTLLTAWRCGLIGRN